MKVNRKPLIFLLLLFVTAALLLWARWRPAQRFDLSAVSTSDFRLVTWNVGYFAITANKNMRDLDVNEVSNVLKAIDAQVVILQELGELLQATRIAGNMGTNWQAYSVSTGHNGQVLTILSPLDVEFEEDIICGGRATKGVTIQDGINKSVYVLGVHSPHPARGMAAKIASIRCSIEHARTRSEAIRLVAGDLNYNFEENRSGGLYTDILTDFGDGTIAAGETYYAHTRIDHVFHYPKTLTVVQDESGMVDLDTRIADIPGFRDHWPIVVSYQL
ncbi:hypothetical protein AB833_20845 [Chromatiales bacterium (ex Bugula neritina AB1)]|nr:hypothetical protein AB833_20845 [Chromatiales bacterium (ex Bugula neritina AB1)]